jgi:PAS domain S-box-containing protein
MSKRLRKGELETTRQTAKFFETLLRISADGIVITDSTHTIIVANETFCTFFGRRCQDIVETGMFSWLEQLKADALNRWFELEKRVRLEGFCRNAKFRMTTKNKVSHFTVNASLLERAADEGPGVIISIWHDVTEHKQAEEALRESAEKYRTLLEITSEGCWLINPELKTIEVNESLCKMLGYSQDEMIGKTPFDFVDDENRKIFIEQTSKISVTAHRSYEITLKKKNGEDLCTYFNATTIMNESGKVQGAFAFITDITEKKQTEEALRKSEERYRSLTDDVLDSSMVGIFILNSEFRVVWVNRALERYFGLKRGEVIGKDKRLLIRELIKDIFEEPEIFYEKVLATYDDNSYIENFECHVLPGGERQERWLEHWSQPIRSGLYVGGRIEHYTDITERKQTEEALRESEVKYRNIFKNIQDVYYEVTLDGIIIEASPSIEDVSLYNREEIIGKSLSDIYVDPKNSDEFQKQLLTNGKVTDYEALMIDKDGSQLPCSITAKLVRDKQGNPVKIIGSLRNITKRKRMEESLREREETLKAILAASPVGICLSRNRIIDWANQAMYRIWGYEEGSLLGKNTQVLYPDLEEYDRVGHQFYSEIEQKGTGQVETRWVTKDGTEIYCYLRGCTLDPSDTSKGVIVGAMDITGRKQAEDLVRNLSQLLMQAQESERQRISRDLHDHVAQELSAVKIGFETLFDNQPNINPEIRRRVSEMSRTLQESIKAVRDVSYDLRPPALDEMGLVETLVQYCNDFSEDNGINVDFHSAGMKNLKLDFDTEINLYRLIQESLTNIKKHADADHVTIRLVAAFPNIILRIKDNGKGFDVQRRLATITKEKRMGIRSMEQRAKLLQGEMEIQSKPMQGTKISITLPYPYKDKKSGSKENHIDNR